MLNAYAYIGEFIGTMLLILLGNGVVAGAVLNKTKSNAGGWIVITSAWGLAVFVGVLFSGAISGGHLNPAVSIALALAGKFAWVNVPFYILFQILGAMFGQLLVYLIYRPHYLDSTDVGAELATFCTAPAIKDNLSNLASEIIGTFVLVISVLSIGGVIASPEGHKIATSYIIDLGPFGGLPVALVVIAIGMSLGGTTGYAINPARDLGPRVIHSILNMKNSKSSGWSYAWIPIVGPIIGAILAVCVYSFFV